MLPKINPTHTKAWKALEVHKQTQAYKKPLLDAANFQFDMQELISYDFSMQNWNEETMKLLLDLAKETELPKAIEAMFSGLPINETEERAVLHTALRDFESEEVLVDGENVLPAIRQERVKIKAFCEEFQAGKLKGYTGKPIKYVVNIGIGGSSIGPQFVIDALKDYKQTDAHFYFVESIDGAALQEVLEKIDLEQTLFLVVSKTFGTLETMTNAKVIKEMLIAKFTEKALAQHLLAVTTEADKAEEFGIATERIFLFWDWVCGRFSLASSVGLVVAMFMGYENYESFLKGAEKADQDFRNTALEKNIPVLNALVGIWNVNFLGAQTQAILPYNKALEQLKAYLQQAAMESNGKSVDRNGELVNYATCPIIWGALGNEAQHSFFQLLHQGTHLIPMDFILIEEYKHKYTLHDKHIKANFYAQIKALSQGRCLEETLVKLQEEKEELAEAEIMHRVFAGGKPLTQILIKELTPYSLAQLVANYEHTYFVQGIIWNLYSFDQWGVELGKSLANIVVKK